MPSLKQRKGTRGEKIARMYLEKKGYTFVESQWHSRFGEIDLIMLDNDELVYIEVKMRKNNIYGNPEHMVSRAKTERLKKTALEYMDRNNIENVFWRFDTVAITGNNLNYELYHFQDTIRDE